LFFLSEQLNVTFAAYKVLWGVFIKECKVVVCSK